MMQCHSCQALLPPKSRFCSQCGVALTLAKNVSRTSRRQMTVLVMDLVDSTRNAIATDPDDLVEALNHYRLISADIARRFGGFLARQVGDGVDLYFGYPTADEDDAVHSLLAAIELVEAVQRIELAPGHSLAVRIGVATGLVAVSLDQGVAVAGTPPNLAARIQAITPPGFIGVAPSTRRIAEGPISFVDFGKHSLKGFEAPISISLVQSARLFMTRSAWRGQYTKQPMVGRDHELAILESLCKVSGLGKLIGTLVTGEAGIGKSRLVNELGSKLHSQGCTSLCLQCLPSNVNTPLYPFIQHFIHAAGFEAGDLAGERHDKLEAQLAIAGIVAPCDGSLIAALIGLPSDTRYPPLQFLPPKQLQLTKEAISRYFAGLASRGSVDGPKETSSCSESGPQLLLVIEDIHWLDPTSLDLLHLMLSSPVKEPMMLLMTARPESELNWPDGCEVRHIHLGRLDNASAQIVAFQSVSGCSEPTDSQLTTIIERSDGVPLFIEEMTREILEGNYDDVQHQRRVPATLLDLLRARLDRLPPDGKAVAQLASVIGREFDLKLLRIVAKELAEPFGEEGLSALHQSSLVLQASANGDRLRFRHALVEDTAYSSISPKRLATLHAAVGSALVAHLQDLAAEQPQVVATHFYRAGQDLQASHWWQSAAALSLSRAAPREAATHLRAGLESLNRCSTEPDNEQHLKEMELNLLSMLGPIMMVLYGPGSSAFGEIQQRAYTLSQSLPGQPRLFPISYAWCLYHWGRTNLDQANDLVTALLDKAAAQPLERELVMASNTMAGLVAFHQGRLSQARGHFLHSLSLYDAKRDSTLYATYLMDFGVFGRFYLALCLHILGDSQAASDMAQDAMQLAQAQPQPHTQGFGMLAVFNIALLQDKLILVESMASQCLAFSTQHSFPEFVAMAKVALGWKKSHTSQNLYEEGLVEMLQGLEDWAQTGFQNWQPWFAVIIAEIQTALGRFDNAKRMAESYLHRIKISGECIFEAPLRAELAAALYGLGEHPETVTTLFNEAIELAKAQQAESWFERILRRRSETVSI